MGLPLHHGMEPTRVASVWLVAQSLALVPQAAHVIHDFDAPPKCLAPACAISRASSEAASLSKARRRFAELADIA